MRSNARQLLRTRGFTLVEVVLAAFVVSVILAGLSSAMFLAARAAETPYKRSALDLHAVLDRFRQDAAIATGITQLGSTSITMTLPDRDGNGTADSVKYDWSQANNTSGTITRIEDGVSESVPVRTASFSVSTDLDQTTTTTQTEGSEQLLFSRSPTLPIAYAIKSSQWCGQYLTPSLPGNAVAWRVTRVRMPARSKGATGGIARVQVRASSGGLPKTVIDEATMLESDLSAGWATQEFSFANAGNLPVNSGVCVVLQWVKDADACEVQYESLLALLASGSRVVSTDGGTTWSTNTLQAMAIEVYGTYSTAAHTTVKKLRGLNIQMKNDSAMANPITTTIRFNNLPTVP